MASDPEKVGQKIELSTHGLLGPEPNELEAVKTVTEIQPSEWIGGWRLIAITVG